MLDEAVDDNRTDFPTNGPAWGKQLLPKVLSFLHAANPPELYLDILVQCIRKTELRSWRTLFAHLPPPSELFEQSLRLNSLKTAGGYLLVLQAFDDTGITGESSLDDEDQIQESAVRLLRLASQKSDWDLCGELARFLIALDDSGEMLKRAVVKVGLKANAIESNGTNGMILPG